MRMTIAFVLGLLALTAAPVAAQEAGAAADEAFCADVADRYRSAFDALPEASVAARDVDAEVGLWMAACTDVVAAAAAEPPASPVPDSVSVHRDAIVLSGQGSFMERRRHRLVGDVQVVVEAEQQDDPFCVLLVSFDYGKKLNRTHGGDELTVRNHGIGTSLHRNLDGRYVLDVVATDECGPWTVTVTPVAASS